MRSHIICDEANDWLFEINKCYESIVYEILIINQERPTPNFLTTDIDHKPRIDKIQFNEIRIMKASQIAVNRKEN